jgi:hypothetical protein
LDYVKRNGIEKYGMLGVGLKKSIPLSVCTQEALFEWRGGFPSGRHLASLPLEKKKTNLGIISMRYRRGGLLYLSITFEGTICHSAFLFKKNKI